MSSIPESEKAYVVITDTHFGLSNDKVQFHNNMELFYSKVFFPFIEQNRDKIRGVIHCGDLFHDRKRINVMSMQRAKEYFFDPLLATQLEMHVILGNHDIYYRERIDLNTIQEMVDLSYDNIRIVDHPMKIDSNTSLIPWIARQNREEVFDFIKNDDSEYAFGHFELNGHNFSKISISEHGDDPDLLSRYTHVYSGHYHYRNTKGNVTYLGAPTQHTWIDAGTKTGFHLFRNGKLFPIDNPYPMFTFEEMKGEIEHTNARYVRLKVPVDAKKNDIIKRTQQLIDSGAIEVSHVTDRVAVTESSSTAQTKTIENIEDTPTFIRSQVEDEEIANMLIEVYNEAVELTGV